MNQLAIDFSTASKINTVKLTRQNKVVFLFLEAGNTITTVRAREMFNVFNLHSRISDLRNKAGIIIYDRMIRIGDTSCKEYALNPFP
jgi:hypothetical protein